jgi:hypothetical protein
MSCRGSRFAFWCDDAARFRQLHLDRREVVDVLAIGAAISVFINDAAVITGVSESFNQTATNARFFASNGNTGNRWDNFQVLTG